MLRPCYVTLHCNTQQRSYRQNSETRVWIEHSIDFIKPRENKGKQNYFSKKWTIEFENSKEGFDSVNVLQICRNLQKLSVL